MDILFPDLRPSKTSSASTNLNFEKFATSQAMSVSHPTIPLLYRALFLNVEPLGALLGALQAHFSPTSFLVTFIQSTPIPVVAQHQIVFDQLAATYFLFAFNEAVVLRCTSDLRVWKAMILGILLCDLVHLYGSYCALGPEVFWNPLLWRWYDAVNLGMLWGPGGIRVAFWRG